MTRAGTTRVATALSVAASVWLAGLTLYSGWQVAQTFYPFAGSASRHRVLVESGAIATAYVVAAVVFAIAPRLRVALGAAALLLAAWTVWTSPAGLWHPSTYALSSSLLALAFWRALSVVLLAVLAAAAAAVSMVRPAGRR